MFDLIYRFDFLKMVDLSMFFFFYLQLVKTEASGTAERGDIEPAVFCYWAGA